MLFQFWFVWYINFVKISKIFQNIFVHTFLRFASSSLVLKMTLRYFPFQSKFLFVFRLSFSYLVSDHLTQLSLTISLVGVFLSGSLNSATRKSNNSRSGVRKILCLKMSDQLCFATFTILYIWYEEKFLSL